MVIILMGMPKSGTSTFARTIASALSSGNIEHSDIIKLRHNVCVGNSMLIPGYVDIRIARYICDFLDSTKGSQSVVLKTHHGIRADAFGLLKGRVKLVSIIRAPEQVVDSAFRHGVRQRKSGHRFHAFSKLRTPALAALWFRTIVYPRVCRWMALEDVYKLKYEEIFESGELLPYVIDLIDLHNGIDRTAFKTQSVHVYRSTEERITAATRLSTLSRVLLAGTAKRLGYPV